ncbi:biotin-dependent carboxyltransferase family protein [Yoonia sp. F2084L]|uniref:5-oxoprolinase subunit C family protein n=1 Tax=Yoonia sp. F2084L TaxID=2926419 RepID=UPI001FF18C2A|nr:biotin-dependent carboxyltransferase family protein [Yoonia sp. F2084L]MCK0095566.1 biotin-dependent carboxyltransferase family protein [Yoonia sp. F2084L]
MAEAAFTVAFAGPLVTLQDAGRPGHMRFGVPQSGAMDRLAFDAANAALGNKSGQTGIEISLGGLVLQCTHGAATVAIAGGDFTVQLGTQKTRSWTILTVQKGERLSITAGKVGSWAYLAFAGRITAPEWLGSQATHATSGFGGGALQSGQTIILSDTAVREDRLGDIPKPDFQTSRPIRVVTGPQDQHFAKETVTQFLTDSFAVSDAFDRMGMRLKGPELPLAGALSIPSEPIVRGSVQVSGDGVPTVLLADHQTTGGYPKIATVISPDIDRLVQHRAGQSVRFADITSAQAVAEARSYAQQKAAYLAEVSVARGTLAQRLMRENLSHGCAFD